MDGNLRRGIMRILLQAAAGTVGSSRLVQASISEHLVRPIGSSGSGDPTLLPAEGQGARVGVVRATANINVRSNAVGWTCAARWNAMSTWFGG